MVTRALILSVTCLAISGCRTRSDSDDERRGSSQSDSLLNLDFLRQAIDLPGIAGSGSYRVTLPELAPNPVVDGFVLTPAMGIESWATLYRVRDSVGVVGQLIGPAAYVSDLQASIEASDLSAGEERALLGDSGPQLVAIDFAGRGSETGMAEAVQDLSSNLRQRLNLTAEADTLEVENRFDNEALGLSFVSRGVLAAGVYQVGIARRELEFVIPEVIGSDGLGFESKLYWQGTPDKAAVQGRLSMLSPVVEQVRGILIGHGFMVAEAYSPPLGESPDVFVIRFFGAGTLDDLVFAVRDALSATAVHNVPDNFEVEVVNRHLDEDATAFALLDDRRILVAHQRSGELQLLVDGRLRERPLLVVPNLLWSYEQGFVGVTVDPLFPDSNYVYTFHTRRDSVNRVSRYRIEGALDDPSSGNLRIDASSVKVLVDVHDASEYHNGGTVRFGPDDKLYVSFGDDAILYNIQDLTHRKAKILRINRDGSAPYDNPSFPSEPANRLREIFAIGLRNPFRFTIDPETGDLLIGDVGSVYIEEFNVSRGGENFGWPLYEGDHVVYEDARLIPPEPTFPAYQYDRISPLCAAIALVSYRAIDFPNDASFPEEYDGTHFVADVRAGPILNLRRDEAGHWTTTTFSTGFARPVDGARGPDGSVYLLEYGRALKKIVYRASAL